MLFADDGVADCLNDRFECAWESVRPVPKAEIDFGNGKRLTRTLNGNVATYFCTTDGRVADIVPGLCTATEYVSKAVDAAEFLATSPSKGAVYDRHRTELQVASRRAERADASKMAVEMKVRTALIPFKIPAEALVADRRKDSVERSVKTALIPRKPPADAGKIEVEAPVKEALHEDSSYNETIRMPEVHALIASNPGARPADLKFRLFREILGYDLEDPYLGLAPLVLGGEIGRK